MQLCQKQKTFLEFFSAVLKSSWSFEHFQKKMTHRNDVFPKLQTQKNVFRWMSKKSGLRGPFEKQHGKRTETLLKSERQHLHHIYWQVWRQFTFKKSLLVISKIFRLFVNTLTADDKLSLLSRDNLMQAIQMQLSQNQKIFCQFFSPFSKSSLNFEQF